MQVSEDGTVTGSIDQSKLDEIEPKTDEARAQLDALKGERAAAEEQLEQDEAKASQGTRGPVEAQEDADSDEEEESSEAPASDELEQLRAEAESLGLKVDRRKGVDTLRAEVEQARQG